MTTARHYKAAFLKVKPTGFTGIFSMLQHFWYYLKFRKNHSSFMSNAIALIFNLVCIYVASRFGKNLMPSGRSGKRLSLVSMAWTEVTKGTLHSPIYSWFSPVMWSKLKIINHSINKFKNLGYDRWLQYKQPHQDFSSNTKRRTLSSLNIVKHQVHIGSFIWCN